MGDIYEKCIFCQKLHDYLQTDINETFKLMKEKEKRKERKRRIKEVEEFSKQMDLEFGYLIDIQMRYKKMCA